MDEEGRCGKGRGVLLAARWGNEEGGPDERLRLYACPKNFRVVIRQLIALWSLYITHNRAGDAEKQK